MECGKYIRSLSLGMVRKGGGYHTGFYVFDIDHMRELVEGGGVLPHLDRKRLRDYRRLANHSRYDCRVYRESIPDGIADVGCYFAKVDLPPQSPALMAVAGMGP
jgi:hypothetical protein